MSQSTQSSAPQIPSSTERTVSPPDAAKSTVSPVTSHTGKRLPDEEFAPHDQEASEPVDAALTAETQGEDESTAPMDAAPTTGEAPSTQESSALAVETAATSSTNSNLSKLGLGALALAGLAAAVAGGGGGGSKVTPQVPSQPSGDDGKPQVPSQPSGDDGKPQVPSQPSGDDGKPQVPSQPSGDDGKPQVPSQPSGDDGKPQVPAQPSGDDGEPQVPSQPSGDDGEPQVPSQPAGGDSKPPPVQVPGVGTKPINGQGVVTVSGVVDGAEWEFSLDDGDTWHKGDGNGVSASDLAEGPNTITIVQTDKDGNRSDAVVVVVIKDSIIEKPVLGTSTGTGAINDAGSISVGGVENNGKWEFSTDGGQTWRPGTGGLISGAELNEGDNTVTVKQTDEAGNVATATIDVVKDSIIEKPVLGTSTGTGAINDAGSISVGGTENNGKWEFSVDGGQTWRPGTGGSISGAELKEGDNTVTVKQTDAAGNVATATITVVKDTLIDKPIVGTSTGTGSINNTGSVTVSGIENNGKWEFSIDGGQTWRPGTGGSISGTELNEGDNTVTVKQTDAAGNVATATITVVKDTLIDKPIVGTSTGTGSINDSGSVTVSGIENNGKWEFSVDGGQTWRPGTGGSISGADLKEGDNTVIVKQTDAAGNVATATITVVKDTLIDKPIVGTSTGTGSINNTGSVTVSGIENNGKWEFSIDGGQTWRPGTGNAISGAELNEGDNTVIVKQTDAAGNEAINAITVSKDLKVDEPTATTSTGGAINDAGWVNVGLIESGAKWAYSLDNGKTWTDGTEPKIPGSVLNEGHNILIIRQTDLAGNSASSTVLVEKDIRVEAPKLSLATDSGAAGDGLTNSGILNVSGLEKDARWEYSIDGGDWQDGSGGSIADPGYANATHAVRVRQTDIAGNQSAESTFTFTIDKAAPVTPQVSLRYDGGSPGNPLTNSPDLKLSGLEVGSKIHVFKEGQWYVYEAHAETGFFHLPGFASDGPKTILVKQVDAAGNASATVSFDFTLDTTAPDAVDLSLLNDTGVAGDGRTSDAGIRLSRLEGDATWKYSLDGGIIWTTGTGQTIAGSALSEGANTVTVAQIDRAGNLSANSSITVHKDTLVVAPTIRMPAAGSKADFDASEQGFAYVVSAYAVDTSSMAALDALSSDECRRVDVSASGGRVELSALKGLRDGYYRVIFSDTAGNLAAATTAGGMKHVQVQGGEILDTRVVMGTSGHDVLTAPNGGGAMISGDGFDTFVFSGGIKGVFDVDIDPLDTIDLRSLGLDSDRFFLEREHRFQRGSYQGKEAILIDWEATGDFTHPDVVLVTSASNPFVLFGDDTWGMVARMFPF